MHLRAFRRRLFKAALRLQKELVPTARSHAACDMDMLVQYAKQVDLLIHDVESIQGALPLDCRIDVDMARRLIICAK